MLLSLLLCLCLPFTFGRVAPTPRRAITNNALPSSANCTWLYFTQKLDHFSPGVTSSTYNERVCIYSKFVTSDTKNPPILFYTGNESPVEEYVNNTGLMWTLGETLNAYLVFAEHRYFGSSVPQLNGVENCLAYCTSSQALADYAMLVNHLKQNEFKNAERSAVIAFGGSYGGMLASWARMKYPSTFQGAIAGSAPIFGFPLDNVRLDGSMIPVTRSASKEGGATDTCKNNILASWPIMREVGKTQEGRDMLADAFNLCPTSSGKSPLPTSESVEKLIQYGHQPWFELAEGDYPFPSEYITYAVANTPVPLPAWPVRVACSYVGIKVNVELEGNLSDVKFDVVVDGGKQVIHVDWNETKTVSTEKESKGGATSLASSSSVQTLMRGLSNAISVWYNVSGTKKCYRLENDSESFINSTMNVTNTANTGNVRSNKTISNNNNNNICTADSIPGGNAAGWGVICCNENLNLVNTLVSGVGSDMFWPPSVYPRDWNRTQIIIESSSPCSEEYARQGLYGVPKTADPFSIWENVYYGGLDGPKGSSNIVFSNGMLDPWTAAGVTNNVSDSVVSVLLKYGGHHLDLFFPSENDPQCAIDARKLEKEHVVKWITDYNKKL